MALLIPNTPTFRSAGERELAALLEGLPGDCVVYHEPRYHRAWPDFVILSPRLGIIVLEAKGWTVGQIETADRFHVTAKIGGRSLTKAHPIEQAKDYMFNLLDFCKGHSQLKSLLTPGGGLRFPIGHAVVLSRLSRDQLESNELGGIFPAPETISADVLEGWKELNDSSAMESALAAYFKDFRPFDRLTADEMQNLRTAINPSREICQMTLVLDDTVGSSGKVEENRKLIGYLDNRQESAALGLGSGHRLLPGVAGSGKTLVLQARARYLANASPDSKVLLLCYNRTLANSLRHQLEDVKKNVDIRTFHSFAVQQGTQWTSDDTKLGEALLTKLNDSPPRFDAVLIDEGQDFDASWFKCAVASLKDPEHGDLVVALDAAQGLYKRRGFTWSSVGIRARGRVETKRLGLYQNYRNTRPIVRAAAPFAEASADGEDDDSAICLTVDTERSVVPGEIPPMIWAKGSRLEEASLVCSKVSDALNGRWCDCEVEPLKPEQIGIFYPPSPGGSAGDELHSLTRRLVSTLGKLAPTIWLTDPDFPMGSNPRDRVSEPGIKVQTIHSAKGLQYRAVIILWSDLLPSMGGDVSRELEERSLFYVALTRAESLLALTHSRPSRFLDEVADASCREDLALPS